MASLPSSADPLDGVALVGERGDESLPRLVENLTHRLSGLAGTIGFPTISARASMLEDLVRRADSGIFNVRPARDDEGECDRPPHDVPRPLVESNKTQDGDARFGFNFGANDELKIMCRSTPNDAASRLAQPGNDRPARTLFHA